MTPSQIELIPDRALKNPAQLLEFLDARGWRMSLLELDTERRRRRNAQRTVIA
jgi:hypothetical protein